MKHDLTERVRDAGYETLFLLGGFLALSVEPTPRNLDRVLRWIDESQARRQLLKRLRERGLVETGSSHDKTGWAARLTGLGRAVFSGGRHPEEEWARPWDHQWRLLTFDLPRSEAKLRMQLQRWLRANYFGHLQGSVWISPQPVKSLDGLIGERSFDPGNLLVFEGGLAGSHRPSTIAAAAWDFESINKGYRSYLDSANRTLKSLKKKTPNYHTAQNLLRDDRKRWLAAVRCDPLLPQQLHPAGYAGPSAWKARGKLLRGLANSIGPKLRGVGPLGSET